MFLSAVTIGELRQGVEAVRHRGDLAQATRLSRWLGTVTTDYADAVLPFHIAGEPDGGSIWLDFTGPPGTREFLAGMLDLMTANIPLMPPLLQPIPEVGWH